MYVCTSGCTDLQPHSLLSLEAGSQLASLPAGYRQDNRLLDGNFITKSQISVFGFPKFELKRELQMQKYF
jgi:hypothetical protein